MTEARVDLDIDHRVLARGARTALAASRHGWLGSPGWPRAACWPGAAAPGRARPADAVRVRDDDGEPVLTSPDGALSALPGCALGLVVASAPGLLRLRLVGRVRPAGSGAVRMSVERVIVGCPHGGYGREVDVELDAYADAWPDVPAARGAVAGGGGRRA